MGTGHRFSGLLRGRWKRALAALSLPLLAACSALPTPVVLRPVSFLGMNALVSDEAPDRPLHVLIVHGMGTPAPYQFEGFIKALADRFGLAQTRLSATGPQAPGCSPAAPAQQALAHPIPRPISIDSVPPDASAQLYTYFFGLTPDDKPKLIVAICSGRR